MNQNEDTNFITNSNNATSINVDYSTNKLPLWAKKGLKIDYDAQADDRTNRSSSNNLVHNHRPNSISSTISSSTPISSSSSNNRTRISLYNSRSTDSDERNSVEDGHINHAQLNESPIERLKKKAQLLSTSSTIKSEKLNGGDHLDASDDLSSLQKKKNPLYVSTENLKFNDNNFFAKTPLSKNMGGTTVQLNSSHNKPAQKPSVLLNSTPKIQLNSSANGSSLNNSLNGSATLKTAASTSSINRPPAISKRREELASALAEARKKLQNLEINRKPTGGLSTSMSVANIHRLPLSQKEHNANTLATAPIQKGHNLSATVGSSPGYAESDAVRRSISLSDLSHNQMLGKSLSIKQQVRNKMNSPAFNNVYYPLRNLKGKPDQTDHPQPQGLWGAQQQQQHDQQAAYLGERLNGLNSSLNTSQNSINQLHHNGSATQHKPIRVRMSRSSSMASINKNDSLLRSQMENYKPQGLWNSPSSLSINTLRSNSSAAAQPIGDRSFNKFNHSKLAHHRKSSDDESSSDENDLYHRISQRPSTPPKPNIRQTLRRSSTTSNNLFLTNSNAGGSPAHGNGSSNFTLQNATSGTVKSTHKANRKSWGNNFELRPAKSEYNLNSMGQETVNSPSSGFWSNHSNNGHSQTNGATTNGRSASGKPNDAIDYEREFDLTNINPATVPLSTELFQHIVDELNHLGTFAKKVHYRAQAEKNQKLQNLLVQGVSKAYVNLATIVPFSSNSVLPITKSLNNKELSSSDYHHNRVNLLNSSCNLTGSNLSNGQHTADSSNTDHDTEEDNHLSSPLNNNVAVGHVSLTSDSASSSLPQESLAMNLLQHYSERLLSMMETQMRSNKDK